MTSPDNAARTATIVGGGPAGLMAAEVLATAGFHVTVYDHKRSVGRKFLLAGRGGLNITHSEDLVEFLAKYRPQHSYLGDAVHRFSPNDLREWCAGLGEETFIGTSGRVFPESFRATPLLRAWLVRLATLDVQFALRQKWLGFVAGSSASRFEDEDGHVTTVTSDVTVMALGGASWPRVGSDGGWVEAFADANIAVQSLQPANCGVQVPWTDIFAERFAGVPIKNVAITVGTATVRGDAMVTTSGLEGGPVYAHSAVIRDHINDAGECAVFFDLQPDLPRERMVERLTQKRRPKESVTKWLKRAGFAPVAVSLLREATQNSLPNDPEAMASLAKAVPVTITAMAPIDRAISTAGGVDWDEIDDSFMLRSRPGVYVVGEMLDWEAPTGGYLLQACFSTAVAAANAASDRSVASIAQLAQQAMVRPPSLGSTRLIVIDGPAGSGKTTISKRLAETLGAQLYHLDEVLEGWPGLANLANRYEHEVLAPLRQDQPATFPEWDWDNEVMGQPITLEPSPTLIIEGVGSAGQMIDGLASLRIWVEAPQDERIRRGLERDGEDTADLWNVWQAQEATLHNDHNTRARADVIIDGTSPLPAT